MDAKDWLDMAGVVGVVVGSGVAIWSTTISRRTAQAQKVADAAKEEAARAMIAATESMSKADDIQARVQTGWLELQLRMFISSRRDRIHDCAKDLETVAPGNSATKEGNDRSRSAYLRFESAHEDFLNALEQACRHYRDGKVDKEAFKRIYSDEVLDVVRCKTEHPFHRFMYPQETSRFQALWAVYNKWYRDEIKR